MHLFHFLTTAYTPSDCWWGTLSEKITQLSRLNMISSLNSRSQPMHHQAWVIVRLPQAVTKDLTEFPYFHRGDPCILTSKLNVIWFIWHLTAPIKIFLTDPLRKGGIDPTFLMVGLVHLGRCVEDALLPLIPMTHHSGEASFHKLSSL